MITFHLTTQSTKSSLWFDLLVAVMLPTDKLQIYRLPKLHSSSFALLWIPDCSAFFQIFQQHKIKKVLKYFAGIWSGGCISLRAWTDQSSLVVIWTAFQNWQATVQQKVMCSGVPSTAWQTSQVVVLTTPFFWSNVLHWILPWESSHVKNFTLGGALFCHTNLLQAFQWG